MKVVYTVSERIAQYVHASINSLLAHNEVEKIWVFTDCGEKDCIPEICEQVDLRDQDWIYERGPNICDMFPWIARVRLAMAKMLPNEDKILYLDADTVVCDSLEPIWQTDMTGKWLGMVDEVYGGYKPFGEHYFNCGVMLMNLKQIREDKIDDAWIDFFNHNYIWLGEQDTLNRFYREDKFVSLPSRYNEFRATGMSDDPAIVHYAAIPDWYHPIRVATMQRAAYLRKWL